MAGKYILTSVSSTPNCRNSLYIVRLECMKPFGQYKILIWSTTMHAVPHLLIKFLCSARKIQSPIRSPIAMIAMKATTKAAILAFILLTPEIEHARSIVPHRHVHLLQTVGFLLRWGLLQSKCRCYNESICWNYTKVRVGRRIVECCIQIHGYSGDSIYTYSCNTIAIIYRFVQWWEGLLSNPLGRCK